MNYLIRTVVLFVFLGFIGCTEDPGIQLRIENISNTNFDKISVNNISFGSLEADAISPYTSFESISDTEFVEIIAGEKTYKFIPETYKGAEFYSKGNYRYTIDLGSKGDILIGIIREY